MSTESLVVSISEKGALVVKRNLEDVGKGAQKAEGAMQLLHRALGLLGSVLLIHELGQMIDEFTQIQNRVRMVTSSQEELNAVTEELYGIAERTRNSFKATAEIYAAVGMASKTLGKSQREMLDFQESLNQALRLGGSSAEEAEGGIRTLAMGLAQGTLEGRELRAILRTMPVVADVMAKGLGTSRGALKELGLEGKVTAEMLFSSFAKAREELAERFAKQVPTVKQAMEVFRDSLVNLVGGVASASGASSGLAEAIIAIAKEVPKLKEPLLALGDIVTGVFKGVVSIFKAWGDSLAKAGIDWHKVLEGLGLGFLALLRTVAQVVDKTIGLVVGLAGALVAAFSTVGTALSDVFKGDWDAAGETMKEGGKLLKDSFLAGFNQTMLTDVIDNTIQTAMDNAAKRRAEAAAPPRVDLNAKPEAAPITHPEFDKYLKQLTDEARLLRMVRQEREVAQGVLRAETSLKEEATPAHLATVEAQLRENQALSDQAGILDQILGPLEDYNRGLAAIDELQKRGIITQSQATDKVNEFKGALRDSRSEFDKMMEKLALQRDLALVAPQEAAILQPVREATPTMTPEQLASYEIQLRTNQALATRAGLLNDILGPQRDYDAAMVALRDNLLAGLITQDQFNQKQRELKDTLLSNTHQMNAMGEVWGAVWGGATNALDSFVETGKMSFGDLAGSILMDIEKIIGKLLLMKAFKAIGIPVPGFAAGGAFTVGGTGGTDSQIVAFKATPGERVRVDTPAQQQKGAVVASGGGLSVKIVNVTDPSEVTAAMASAEGEKVIVNVISRNKGPIKQELS